jgi:imidazole glycerol-phosphate synthase subunit HisH
VRHRPAHVEDASEHQGLAVIALVDYGAGNLTSVKKAFGAIGADLYVPRMPSDLADASAVVVPGVGHFGATRALAGGWTDAILERVGEGRPLLGICLGMHWLFESSEEAPGVPGLGVMAGTIGRLGTIGNGGVSLRADVKIPHVGWNALTICREAPIVSDIKPGVQMYFSHTYAAPITSETIAVTEHGLPFAAVVQRGQIAGMQFHPEKSGEPGLQMLRNFAELAR